MKNLISKIFILVASIAIMTSCTSSDDDNNNSSTFVANPDDFKGDINDGTVTLDPTKVYKLTGRILVKDGAQLIIPAGTVIGGVGGTSAYIGVAQGGKLFVNGTATSPVVMTSGLAVKQPGDWGGVVICGRAHTNKGATASAEVSDLTYGGTIDNDNSGSIRYLRIEYSGAAFNSEKEFNGLSLFGVGSGTTIEYVQIHEGADDGFEFYGGSVKASYLVSTSNEDDQFDWTEGWNGKNNTNWYGKLGLGRGNRGIEADGLEENHAATPYSFPTITNLTLIGLGNQGNEPQAIQLRRGTKAVIDNVVLTNWNIGVRVTDAASHNWMGGDLKVTNVKFTNIAAANSNFIAQGFTGTLPSGTWTENTNATGAGFNSSIPAWAQGWTVGL